MKGLKAKCMVGYYFAYREMDNHEYAINLDGDEDVLDSLVLTREELKEFGLEEAYQNARRKHMKRAGEEWGII